METIFLEPPSISGSLLLSLLKIQPALQLSIDSALFIYSLQKILSFLDLLFTGEKW
jgi:hypothetical protein